MLSRNLDKALEAYRKRDAHASRQAHTPSPPPDAVEKHKKGGEYIKSAVYGGLDGTITTFAVVAGVAGASLSPAIVLIMGFANLIADGLSMAIGDYLSTKAEREYQAAERERERWEVENYAEGEKQELVELYEAKGIPKPEAEQMVSIVARHKEAWVDVMMVEELGILPEEGSPLKNAVVTFLSFAVFGIVPVIAYVVGQFVPFVRANAFLAASVLTGLTLFALGSAKVRITGRNWFRSGLEILVVGGVAAAAAYLVGYALGGLA